MISGDSALTPVDTMRASGVRPSSLALASDVTTRAAAPSLSAQQLPAVTTPSGRNTGIILLTPRGSRPVAAVVDADDGAVRSGDRGDLPGPEAVDDRLLREVLAADA
jgi:hypothetical protein